jgi:flagellar biosynthesis protein FlhG
MADPHDDDDLPTSPGAAGIELFREPASDDDDAGEAQDAGAEDVDLADLAESLDATAPRRSPRARPQRIVAVAGAKGGVGKTLVATNLAIYFATIGRRVVLVDAESVGANIHTFLGVERPGHGAGNGPPRDVSDGDPDLFETPIPGLRIFHAGIDEPAYGHVRRTRRVDLLARLRELDAEYIVVDLGAGTSRSLLDFWLDADHGVYVSLPEPTAIDNTYRFVRASFARHVERTATDPEVRRRLVTWLRRLGNTPSPLDLARRLEAAGDDLSDLVRARMESFVFRLVLNQTRVRSDLELGDAMRSAVRRRLGVGVHYLGYIDYDDTVWNCLRMRRPLLVESPGTKASKCIEKIARRLLSIEAGKGPRETERTVPAESHHDLLEVERGATDEEVRRAYKRVRDIYAPDALAVYGLFDANAMESLRARLEEAYDVLLDPARRRPYELSVFPADPEPQRAPPLGDEGGVTPPPPVLTPDTEYTGALLRAVRESQGVDVMDIAQRTKIGSAYLQAIEDDDYGALPAPVYVRGFVTEMAKFLRLDPAQVSRTYVRRYMRHLEERDKAVG